MSAVLEATLERIAQQQEANTVALANLVERQNQTDSAIARLVQMTERLAPQMIENTERINNLSGDV